MANGATTKVTVTEIPTMTLERLREHAIDNGVSPNSYPAVIRWALAQYNKILNGVGKAAPVGDQADAA
jgi:hypothetical protein